MIEKYYKTESYVLRRFGEEALLVPLQVEPARARELYSLNPLACEIFAALDGQSLGEIVDRLADEYEVARETLEADVKELLGQLQACGCVQARPAG